MTKKFSYGSAIKAIAVVFMLSYLAMVLWAMQDLYHSDTYVPDALVLGIRESGFSQMHNYIACERFLQFDLLCWVPNYLLNLIVPDMVTADKLMYVLLFSLMLLFIWLTTKNVAGEKAAWLAVALCGCGISTTFTGTFTDYIQIVHQVYTIAFLWIVSCFLKCRGKDAGDRVSKRKYIILSVCLLVYVSYTAMIDQRYLATFVAPMCVALALNYYLENYNVSSFRELLRRPKYKIVILCLICVGTVLGLAVSIFARSRIPFDARLASAGGAFAFADLSNFFEVLTQYILGMLELWGCEFDTAVSTMSVESIIYIIKGVACVACMVLVPVLCLIQYKKLPDGMKILTLFYFVLSLELFYVYGLSVLNQSLATRYFLYEIPVSIMISAWYFQERVLEVPNLNRMAAVFCLIVFCLTSQAAIFKWMKASHENGIYESREGLIDYLEENDLSYGYATYWNSQVLTTMSNNKVRVRPVGYTTTLLPFLDCNYIYWFTEDYYTGSTFLMLAADERQYILESAPQVLDELGEPEQVLQYANYYIYVYDHNITRDLPYFPYNENYIPPEGSYGIKDTVLSDVSGKMEATAETEVVWFPIELEPNLYYRLIFTAGTDSEPALFYSDLFANNQFLPMQVANFSIARGSNTYEAVIPTGDIEADNLNNTMLRFVAMPSSRILIDDICLQKLEVYRYSK